MRIQNRANAPRSASVPFLGRFVFPQVHHTYTYNVLHSQCGVGPTMRHRKPTHQNDAIELLIPYGENTKVLTSFSFASYKSVLSVPTHRPLVVSIIQSSAEYDIFVTFREHIIHPK